MKLPERKYYSINDAAIKLGCSVNDILHYASVGLLNLCVYLDLKCNVDEKNIYLNIPPEKINQIDDCFQILDGDKWTVGNIKFMVCGENDNKISGFYSGELFGFFYIHSTEVLRAEFTQDEEVKISFLSTNPEDYDGDDVEISLLKDGGEIFKKSNFCLMASEIKNLDSTESGQFPKQKESSDRLRGGNDNKKNKFIKALIEITYGPGSSDNIYALMREGSKNSPPGYIVTDFEQRGFKLPAGHKTVQGWVNDAELESLEISKPSMEISKK